MKSVSVKQKIGIIGISDEGYLLKDDGTKMVFFRVEPSNLAVLSETNIRSKVINLAGLAKSMGGMQIYALDDRENYGANRKFIRDRIDEETIPAIRYVLEQEELYVKSIEADSSSARLFLLAFTIKPATETKDLNQLAHLRNLAIQSNMTVEQLTKDDVKRMLAVYFKHDTTSDALPDLDGQNHYDDVDFDRLRSRIRNGEVDDTDSFQLPKL